MAHPSRGQYEPPRKVSLLCSAGDESRVVKGQIVGEGESRE